MDNSKVAIKFYNKTSSSSSSSPSPKSVTNLVHPLSFESQHVKYKNNDD